MSLNFNSATTIARTAIFLARRLADAKMKIIVGVILGIFILIGCTLWLGYSTCNYPINRSNETNQTTSPNEKDCSTYRSTLIGGLTQTGVYIREFREEIVA